MKRIDQKKTVESSWDGNYGPGRSTYDESTVELNGTRREADLIIRGLKALQAQVLANEAAGVVTKDEDKWDQNSLGEAPRLPEIEALLGTIAVPKYVGEPIVEHVRL